MLKTKLLLPKATSIMIATAIAIFFVSLTGIANLSEWYSPDLNYRLQTDALLSGKLAIQNHPYAHGYDWVWGNGMHQNWGLGVPFLRFPFEVLSHVFGISGFPDRLVFIFFFALSALAFAWGIKSIRNETALNTLSQNLESWLITLVCFISPTFIAMGATRFDVYEEAVAYSCLWALGLAGLLLRLANRPKIYLFLLLCFLAGFSSLIRPTGLFYGIVTFGLAIFVVYKSHVSFRHILLGLAIFCFFPIVHLFTNYLRFGEFFEFGYHRILDMIPLLGFMLKFDYPFANESFFYASYELFGSLFLVKNLNGLNFFQEFIHPWQADSIRFREYYFPGFSLIILTAMLAGSILAFSCNKVSFSALKLSENAKKSLSVMSLWSILSFFLLFLFYLRTPAFSSRYVIDFLPALVLGTSILIYFCMVALNYFLPDGWRNIVLIALIIAWLSGNAFYAKSIDKQRLDRYKPPSADRLYEIVLMYPVKPDPGPPLPSIYSSDSTKSNYDIPNNLWGWYCYPDQHPGANPQLVGIAGPAVTLFFGPFECLELKIKEWRPNIDDDIDAIQVKVGTQMLVRKNIESVNGIQKITFCPRKTGSITKKWNMVTLGLARTDQLNPKFFAPFKLLSVEALQERDKPDS